MIYPTVKQLTNDEFNRYELVIGVAKCARIVTDEYIVSQQIKKSLFDSFYAFFFAHFGGDFNGKSFVFGEGLE